MNSEHTVADLHRLQGNIAWDERQRTLADAEISPVGPPIGPDLKAQHRLGELNLLRFNDALQQRRHGEPHGEAVGAEERVSAAAAAISDPYLAEAHVGGRQKPEIDVAADPYLTAENARGLFLKHTAIAVPVDKARNREQRPEHDDKQPGDPEKDAVHAVTTPTLRDSAHVCDRHQPCRALCTLSL